MAFREDGEGIRINTEYKREELLKIQGTRWGGGMIIRMLQGIR